MKANAPDKIHVQPNAHDRWFEGSIPSGLPDGLFVEQTRTDAFIEKAVEFFGEHLLEYINVKNANCDTFINIDGDKLKEDFRKYIKGE